MSKLSVKEVNQLAENEFQEIFGNIIECYPKTAEFLYKKRPFENEREMLQITLKYLHELPLSEKGKILQLHPDLAGKLAQEGQLTHESTEEQKAAGLNKLTLLQKKEMDYLNNQYKTKFGFPFIICARENKVDSILKGLKTRLEHEKPQELLSGIEEVKKICTLRLKDIVEIK